MFDFRYNLIHKHSDGAYDLHYSDTDSLVYHTTDENLKKRLFENEEGFDLSNVAGKIEAVRTLGMQAKLNQKWEAN